MSEPVEEATLQDRAIESEKEVIRLASLLRMHRTSGLLRERNDLLEELGRLDPELVKAKRLAENQ